MSILVESSAKREVRANIRILCLTSVNFQYKSNQVGDQLWLMTQDCNKPANKLLTSFVMIVNKLLTTSNKLVGTIRLVTRLFQQDGYSHDITILLQACVVNFVAILLQEFLVSPCNRSNIPVKPVSSCERVVPNPLATCEKQCEHNLFTAC